MKPHVTKPKLSFEEVKQMLDDFYNEVEIKEKADGVSLHVSAHRSDDQIVLNRLRHFFRLKPKDRK